VVVFIDRISIRASAAVSNPHARAGPHDGLKRSNQATRWMLNFDSVDRLLVDVRFSVCKDHHALTL
jgi:hypothetical protein